MILRQIQYGRLLYWILVCLTVGRKKPIEEINPFEGIFYGVLPRLYLFLLNHFGI